MGLLDSILGNVSEVEASEIEEEFEPLLITDEEIETVFALMRDLLVFTTRRLIKVDKQGLTGKKVKYDCIPYHSIHRFIIESAGTFDAEAELQLAIRGEAMPMKIQLSRKIDTGKVSRVLAQHIL